MLIDVEELGCDMLTARGRKFLRAPRGTEFLYMRQTMLDPTEPALLDLFGAVVNRPWHYQMRRDARRFEPADAVRKGLAAIEGVTMRDAGTQRSASVSFTVEGIDATEVMLQLQLSRVNVSVSPPTSKPLGALLRQLPSLVRASPHCNSGESEVDALIGAVAAV